MRWQICLRNMVRQKIQGVGLELIHVLMLNPNRVCMQEPSRIIAGCFDLSA